MKSAQRPPEPSTKAARAPATTRRCAVSATSAAARAALQVPSVSGVPVAWVRASTLKGELERFARSLLAAARASGQTAPPA